MSYYELPAEGRGYYLFEHRMLGDARAHFHSAVEFVFVESGRAEAIVDGESRLLSAGQACFSDSFRVHFYREAAQASVYVLSETRAVLRSSSGNRGIGRFRNSLIFPIFRFSKSCILSVRQGAGIPLRRCGGRRKCSSAGWLKACLSKAGAGTETPNSSARCSAMRSPARRRICLWPRSVGNSDIRVNTFPGFGQIFVRGLERLRQPSSRAPRGRNAFRKNGRERAENRL